ncbi:PD-(D/E)XK nuclease-like domain-containing protein [Nonomuraea pusilla]|uniref:PD-(D/E)XK nuclease superfamily n=1 Tax=Nonomuraea pusilla TaxID=46177 RepID=A0A1H8K7Z7_9ACTN|nr:PD-(D/E)XK nuclease-like domain-containing protein [Nonomuraea pusilla]SEN89064.1 PD-(D/E)XK nuclease superfamily [Nonomuraea pusilla]
MTATASDVIPGVYDISEELYHSDPVPGGSLSSSSARKLLPPSCPALFRWYISRPQPPRKEFDFGHAAHLMVLGTGPELVVVEAKDWRTKAAKEQRDAAYQSGKVPILVGEHRQAKAMAAALRAHPIASAVLNPEIGDPEQTLIWQDSQTGVWRRARLDWLPNGGADRFIVADYKTTRSANPAAIQRSVYSYGYHAQQAWYLDGVEALGLAADPAMVFIFQEKMPPYLVTVVQLDSAAVRAGRAMNRQAIDIYRQCVETGRWPGYTDDIPLISLPAWADYPFEETS